MNKYLLLLVSSTFFIASLICGFYFVKHQPEEMNYTSFLQAIEQKQVDSILYSKNADTFKATLKSNPEKQYQVDNPKTESFIEQLLLHDVSIKYTENTFSLQLVRILTFACIGFAVFFFVKKRNSQGFHIFNTNQNSSTKSNVTLTDVAGNEEAKSMTQDIIDFIKSPEKYSQVGAKMPRGLLFYGPPGTGKTLMAKAIAGEADVPFYAVSGSDFVQMYVGVGANRIRSLFKKAKKDEKAIIFIDEIDAIGKQRARNVSASNDERDQTLNALLTEMSGFHDNAGIVIIGATNRLDTLDEALLRPGRFDRQIEIGLPDLSSRKKILSCHAKDKPLADDVDMEHLAISTIYFSGSMLANLLNEAAIYAANQNQNYITNEHIDHAFYTILAGSPKEDRSSISEADTKITAYHEAGHALITQILLPEHYISKVTIIPSTKGAGGFNFSIPKDTLFYTKKQLKSSIMMLLGGRAAEDLIYGSENITTGASDDLKKASKQTLDFLNKYGMSPEKGLFNTNILPNYYSEELVEHCHSLMGSLYEETKELLKNNMDSLRLLSKELLEKETLDQNDITRICRNTIS